MRKSQLKSAELITPIRISQRPRKFLSVKLDGIFQKYYLNNLKRFLSVKTDLN